MESEGGGGAKVAHDPPNIAPLPERQTPKLGDFADGRETGRGGAPHEEEGEGVVDPFGLPFRGMGYGTVVDDGGGGEVGNVDYVGMVVRESFVYEADGNRTLSGLPYQRHGNLDFFREDAVEHMGKVRENTGKEAYRQPYREEYRMTGSGVSKGVSVIRKRRDSSRKGRRP